MGGGAGGFAVGGNPSLRLRRDRRDCLTLIDINTQNCEAVTIHMKTIWCFIKDLEISCIKKNKTGLCVCVVCLCHKQSQKVQ